MNKTSLVLASTSPRRKELVSKFDVFITLDSPNCDETLDYNKSFKDAIMDLALRKAKAVQDNHASSLILAADTLVILKGEALGKPKDAQEAFSMLKKLSGKTHEVITGATLLKEDKHVLLSSNAFVTFQTLDDEDIESYIQSEEPFGKAGAYAIQGIGAKFVKSIKGDYYAIMGLPVNKVYNALKCYRKGNLFEDCNSN